MSEWQPIETAPKDGRHILIWDWEGLASIVEIYWAKDSDWEGWVYAEELLAEACPEVDDPTHWQPVPEPPK